MSHRFLLPVLPFFFILHRENTVFTVSFETGIDEFPKIKGPKNLGFQAGPTGFLKYP